MARQPATALWERVKQPFFLGFEVFIESLRRQVPAGSNRREVLPARARPIPKPLVDLAQQSADRDNVIATADLSGSYTLKKMGDYFDPDYSRPSRIVRLTEQARRKAKEKTRPLVARYFPGRISGCSHPPPSAFMFAFENAPCLLWVVNSL